MVGAHLNGNNPFANSGTVVQINMEDVKGDMNNPFRMLNFQQQAEHLAFKAGGGNLVAPAQRMVDFVEGRVSMDLPENSYLPGLQKCRPDRGIARLDPRTFA